jgi:hypothetical protein
LRAGEKVGRKRRRLTNKVAAVGVWGPKEFGEDFYVTAQEHHPEVGTSEGPGVPATFATRR